MGRITCECCRSWDLTTRPRVTHIPHGPYGVMLEARANLCQRCVDDHHGLNRCNLCPGTNQDGSPYQDAWVWTCAMLDHAQREHPRMLERLRNDPMKDLQAAPKFEYLGKLPRRLKP